MSIISAIWRFRIWDLGFDFAWALFCVRRTILNLVDRKRDFRWADDSESHLTRVQIRKLTTEDRKEKKKRKLDEVARYCFWRGCRGYLIRYCVWPHLLQSWSYQEVEPHHHLHRISLSKDSSERKVIGFISFH